MKQYLVSEDELNSIHNGSNKVFMDFLKSKKPVRLVASGHIYYTQDFIDVGVGNMEHLEYGFNGLTPEIAKENESCSAQLFIEEDK